MRRCSLISSYFPACTSCSVPACTSCSVPARTSCSVPARTSCSVPSCTSCSVPACTSCSVPSCTSCSVPACTSCSLPACTWCVWPGYWSLVLLFSHHFRVAFSSPAISTSFYLSLPLTTPHRLPPNLFPHHVMDTPCTYTTICSC